MNLLLATITLGGVILALVGIAAWIDSRPKK